MFDILSGLVIFLGAIIVLVGARLLFGTSWILGWIRGTAGFALIAVSALIILGALDLFSYQQVIKNRAIATISLKQLGEQEFTANLSLIKEGIERPFTIKGDQWQLDARIIRWRGIFLAIGAKPGFRLDRLSGRYYSLEDEHRKERTVHQLSETEYGIDIWAWFKDHGKYIPIIDASYGSATYLPMVDGAIYEVAISSSGLVATPVNNVAQDAIQAWQ